MYDFESAKLLFQAIAKKHPERLGDVMSYNLKNPATWLALAEKVGDADIKNDFVELSHTPKWIEEQKFFDRTYPKVKQRTTFLHMAMDAGDRETVRWILTLPGIDLNAQLVFGNPVLASVPYSKDSAWMEEMYERLLKRGADFARKIPGYDNTELHRLIANEKIEALYLVRVADKINREHKNKKPYSFDLQDNEGKTPLRMAVVADAEVVVDELLKAGANPNIPDKNGVAALHCAAARGNPRMVMKLLKHKADIYAKDNNGLTPFDYLQRRDLLDPLLTNVNIRPGRPFDAVANVADFTPLEQFIRALDPPKGWPEELSDTPLGDHCLLGHKAVAELLVFAAAQRLGGEDEIPLGDVGGRRDEVARNLYHSHQAEDVFRIAFNSIVPGTRQK